MRKQTLAVAVVAAVALPFGSGTAAAAETPTVTASVAEGAHVKGAGTVGITAAGTGLQAIHTQLYTATGQAVPGVKGYAWVQGTARNTLDVAADWKALPDGRYVLQSSVKDTAGAQGSQKVNLTVDNTKPVVSLVSPAAAAITPGTVLEFAATDAIALNRIVANVYKDGVAGVHKPTQKAAGGSTAVSHTVDTTGFPDGSYSVKFNATDLAGNLATTLTHSFVVDGSRPVVTITDPVAGTALTGRYTLRGTATDGLSGIDTVTVQVRSTWSNGKEANVLTSVEVPVVAGAWQYRFNTADFGDAVYAVSVFGSDKAGNEVLKGGPTLKPLTFDNTAPVAVASVEGRSVVWSATDNHQVSLLDAQIWTADGSKYFQPAGLVEPGTATAAGSFELPAKVVAGSYTLRLKVRDAAGNQVVTNQAITVS